MRHWNFRVIEFIENDETRYSIHEVFYDDNDKLYGYIEDPVKMQSDSVEGLIWMLRKLPEAIEKPVLKESDLT